MREHPIGLLEQVQAGGCGGDRNSRSY